MRWPWVRQPYAVVRDSARQPAYDDALCTVLDGDEQPIGTLPLRYFGRCWGDHYWTLDLVSLGEGTYQLRYPHRGGERTTAAIRVARGLFRTPAVDRYLYELAIRYQENRLPHGGYMDCGSPLREISSHCETGFALLRCLERWPLSPAKAERLRWHLREISHYCRHCRLSPGVYAHEAAGTPELWEGSQLHRWCRAMRTYHDTAYAGLLHARVYTLFGAPEDLADARASRTGKNSLKIPGWPISKATPTDITSAGCWRSQPARTGWPRRRQVSFIAISTATCCPRHG
jgi:hypothetical protein